MERPAEALNQALFVPSATGALTTPATVTFKYSNGDLQATKTFSFDASYVLHAEVQVTRGGVPERALLSWPGGFGDQNDDPRGGAYANAQFDNDRGGSDQHLAPKKISGGATLTDPFDWAGRERSVLRRGVPARLAGHRDDGHAATTSSMSPRRSSAWASTRIRRRRRRRMMPILGVAFADSSGPTETRIFVGPKAINILKGIHAANPKVTLEPLLEFGFWGFIGKYLFLALQFLHSHVAAELGLGHHHPDRAHQHPDAAVPGEDHAESR